MTDERLATHVEVAALIRRVEGLGGSGMVLARGDRERGGLLLLIAERGVSQAVLERMLDMDGRYAWQKGGPTDSSESRVAEWATARRRNDPDLWLVELDIVPSARFIDETIGTT